MRLQLLSPSGAHLVGFAKKKLRQLKELRGKTGRTITSKSITVGGFRVYLETGSWGDTIRIEGGEGGVALLSGESGTAAYDYEKNHISRLDGVNDIISPLCLKEVVQAGVSKIKSALNNVLKRRPIEEPSVVIFYPKTNSGFFIRNNQLIENGTGAILANLPGGTFLPKGANVGTRVDWFEQYPTPWASIDSFHTWEYPINAPDDFAVGEHGWRPAVFYESTGEHEHISGGLHYKLEHENYLGPFNFLNVALSNFIAPTKYGGFGYAEILKTGALVNKEEVKDYRTAVFFSALPSLDNNLYTNVSIHTITLGQLLGEITPLFYIDYSALLSQNIEVYWAEIAPEEYVVVGYDESVFVVHRVVDKVPIELYSETGFLDCSIDFDGQCLLVLTEKEVEEVEQEGGEAAPTQKVYVFKFLERDPEVEGDVAVSIKANTLKGRYRFIEFVPFSTNPGVKEPEEDTPPVGSINMERPDIKEVQHLPALFGMTYPDPPENWHSVYGWKITIACEGSKYRAKAFLWEDDCWKKASLTQYKNVYQIDEGRADKLVGAGHMETADRYIYHTTGGVDAEGIPSSGGSLSIAAAGENIERVDVRFWWEVGDPCAKVSKNTKWPFTFTHGAENTGSEEYPCWVPKLDCSKKIKMVDSCNESYEVDFPDIEQEIIGPDNLYVSASYSFSGGVAPITYSMSCGKIDPDSGVVSSVEGCCGSVTVTATDDCGTTVSKTVRAELGQWVLRSEGLPVNFWGAWLEQTVISGDTKTDLVYLGAGYECSPQRLVSTACVDNSECVSTCHGPVTSCGGICGHTSAKHYTNVMPPITARYSGGIDAPLWCADYNAGNYYVTFGFLCWAIDNDYTKVWKWECP